MPAFNSKRKHELSRRRPRSPKCPELGHFKLSFWRGRLMQLSVSSPRGGGGEGRTTHGNLTVAYIPRVGILIGHHAFDLSILYSRREENHLFLLILTILFCPGVGILIILFRKCQNPYPMLETPPPPGGLDTDRCVRNVQRITTHVHTYSSAH